MHCFVLLWYTLNKTRLTQRARCVDYCSWNIGPTLTLTPPVTMNRYAMLIGRPPFETATLKETYVRITSNKYYLPSHISSSARQLIRRLLSPEPSQRPSLEKILADDFFSAGYTPKLLASSCCEWAPKYSVARILPRSVSLGPSCDDIRRFDILLFPRFDAALSTVRHHRVVVKPSWIFPMLIFVSIQKCTFK